MYLRQQLLEICYSVSLNVSGVTGLVSPGAATDRVTHIFSWKNRRPSSQVKSSLIINFAAKMAAKLMI